MIIRVLYAKPKMRFPIGSWLIRLVEGTKGSHIAVQIDSGDFELPSPVFESIVPRSRVVSNNRWGDHYEVISAWDFPCGREGYLKALAFAFENTDKLYSRIQCILIGIGDLFGGKIKKAISKMSPNGNDYLICVEADRGVFHQPREIGTD
jgi:hypothetical protein